MTAPQRILAVDDNVDNLLVLKELLDDDYRVRCAKTGEEALRVAPEFRPDLILLDVMMPGIDGAETCRRLRSCPELLNTKIVMLSAKSELRDRLKAYDCGAEDYIAKPFDYEEVLAKIAAWMRMVRQTQIDKMWEDVRQANQFAGVAVALVADFRETETSDHLFRVRWYAQTAAEQLACASPYSERIDEEFLQSFYRAAPLHDIGKVSIDPQVLRKNGPLSTAELKAVQQHARVGAELLSLAAQRDPDSQHLAMAAAIARSHHERYDGSGYPDGLRGDEIPLAARIFAVADVFDALISESSYKPAMSVESALSIIADKSGAWFDPVVVDGFLARAQDLTDAQASLSVAEERSGPDRPDPALIGSRYERPIVHLDSDHSEYSSWFASIV